jgi:hypothetical protein
MDAVEISMSSVGYVLYPGGGLFWFLVADFAWEYNVM